MKAFWKKGRRAFTLGVALFSLIFASAAAFAITMSVGYAANPVQLTGFNNDNLSLSYEGSGTYGWSIKDGNEIYGHVKSEKSGGCNNPQKNYSTSLTIKSNLNLTASLSFDYSVELQGGSISIGESSVETNGQYGPVSVPSNGSIAIVLQSGDVDNDTEITVSNVAFSYSLVKTTFLAPLHGSYSVDGQPILSSTAFEYTSDHVYEVNALASAGYSFHSWHVKNEDILVNQSSMANWSLSLEVDSVVNPVFINDASAQFQVGGQTFLDLDEAVFYATKQNQEYVIALKDGNVEGQHTIPFGVTLFIPRDASTSVSKKEEPATIRNLTGGFAAYRTLKFSSGSELVVFGNVYVAGVYYTPSGSQVGELDGPYGRIDLEDGSKITVRSGASIYAWGFVCGDGVVTIEKGAQAYEWMQILDFRGGSKTSTMENNVFLFNQYAVQNIEASLEIKAGGNETVYTGFYASKKEVKTSVPFIGDQGMFQLSSGSISKKYDSETGRCVYKINGNASFSNIKIKVIFVTVNSSDYVFPITNNMSIFLDSGKLTLEQNAALLPGVECSIAKDAEMVVSSGKSLYVYDSEQWINEHYSIQGDFKTAVNLPNGKSKFGENGLSDAKIDVNGTLTIKGNLYTTKGGAQIISSSKMGKYNLEKKPESQADLPLYTYQYDQSADAYDKIEIEPAKLQNPDCSYFTTLDLDPQTIVVDSRGFWGKIQTVVKITITYHIGGGHSVEINAGSSILIQESTDFGDSRKAWAWSTTEDRLNADLYWPNATQRITFNADTDLYPVYQGWVNNERYFDESLGMVRGFYYIDVPNGDGEYAALWFNEEGKYETNFESVCYYNDEYYYVKNGKQDCPNGNWYVERSAMDYSDVKYYYFLESGYSYRNCTVYIDSSCILNGATLLPPGWYSFGNEGFIEKADDYKYDSKKPKPLYVKDVSEKSYCFYEGVKAGIGLFECDGYVYYAQKDASIFKNGTLYVNDTNGITGNDGQTLQPGLYSFDENGHMRDSSYVVIEKASA